MDTLQSQLFPLEQMKILKHPNRKTLNQYFTPEFAVESAFSFIQRSRIKNVIDPGVGNGVFLRMASKIWYKANLFGIDIDKKVILQLKELNSPNSSFFCSNSLLPNTWKIPEIQNILTNGGFDLVAGNPPFSSWFNRIQSKEILSNYQLARQNGKITRSLGIEILFLEIFINLAKENGFLVIVLPDGILSNPQYKYGREFILKNTKVLHIISLPRNVFQDTSAKTSILILQKMNISNIEYFAEISDLDKTGKVNNSIKVRGEDLLNRMDYYYYGSLSKCSFNKLSNTNLTFKPLHEFTVYCKTGKTLYGKERKFSSMGLRFLHATNITEIGINYKKDEKFIDASGKMNFQDAYAKVGDILFVRVGVGCAGRVAIIDTKEDEGIASDYIHILRVRNINPYFLVLYLKTRFGRDSTNLLKHGVGTVSINKTDVLSIPIPIVSKEFQKEVCKKYKNILEDYHKDLQNDGKRLKTKIESLIHHIEENLINGGSCG
jgi:type I restriction enzyme M protein